MKKTSAKQPSLRQGVQSLRARGLAIPGKDASPRRPFCNNKKGVDPIGSTPAEKYRKIR
jgi:hypothetical protein